MPWPYIGLGRIFGIHNGKRALANTLLKKVGDAELGEPLSEPHSGPNKRGAEPHVSQPPTLGTFPWTQSCKQMALFSEGGFKPIKSKAATNSFFALNSLNTMYVPVPSCE